MESENKTKSLYMPINDQLKVRCLTSY